MSARISLVILASVSTLGLTSCSEGGAGDKIVLVSRQDNSGTYHCFRETVLGEDREFKQGAVTQSGSKDVVALVGSTRNAIGYSGIAFDTDKVKVLKIFKAEGQPAVAPTAQAAQDGSYPIARPLYIYTREEPAGATKAYLEWILSEEGQRLVQENGYVPVKPREGPVTDPGTESAVIKVKGSDTMAPLAQAWAEAYQKKHPNVSIQVSGGGSSVGITGIINGTVDLADASRKMESVEVARAKQQNGVEPKEYIVGLDALAVYVHADNPLDSISIPVLAEIYGDGGKIENWSQVTGKKD